MGVYCWERETRGPLQCGWAFFHEVLDRVGVLWEGGADGQSQGKGLEAGGGEEG